LMLRRIFGRAELTEREARSLLGIIKRIRWRISHGQERELLPSDARPQR
jgi:tRNA/rRNA methyltransferase